MSDLFVIESSRKLGLGNWLVSKCEEISRQNNAKFISLSVKKDSWIHLWYNKLGYEDYFSNSDDGSMIQLIKTLT